MRNLLLSLLLILALTSCATNMTNQSAVATYNAGNYEESFKMLKELADKGDVRAQRNLAIFYYNGKGVKQDLNESSKWFDKADNTEYLIVKEKADRGDVVAQYELYFFHKDGKGVKQDNIEAIKWLEKSVDGGYLKAKKVLGNVYFEGKIVKQDYKKAFKIFEEIANSYIGDKYIISDSRSKLGEMYQKGLGVKQDYEKAVYWYERSDISIESSQNLGDMYYNGEGVKQDYKKAFETYKKVPSLHNYYNLGIMYYKGEGTKVDKEKAYKYWTSCSKSSIKEIETNAQEKLDILCKESPEICINKK